ncbi:MAG: hypothetical protein PUA73_04760 [Bacilli bacterium]|nr:hypothetical protein [Bacilli bacterium]
MKINKILKNYDIKPCGYQKVGKIVIVDDHGKKYVYKEGQIDLQIFDYLKSRNFDYMPSFLNGKMDNYRLSRYIENFDIPSEQKMLDLVHIVALLHLKTTHYKEIDLDFYERIYDDLDNNLKYLYSYYTDLITTIETKVYMSPCQQLLARNISQIYDMISDNKKNLDRWHLLIKEKRKQRMCVIHNNLKLSHFLENDNCYLISWDKAKIGSPIFDLYKLYMNHGLDFDFEVLFKTYEKYYPLFDDERLLLYILITQVKPLDFNNTEYQNCLNISNMLNLIYKAKELEKKFKDTNKQKS